MKRRYKKVTRGKSHVREHYDGRTKDERERHLLRFNAVGISHTRMKRIQEAFTWK